MTSEMDFLDMGEPYLVVERTELLLEAQLLLRYGAGHVA